MFITLTSHNKNVSIYSVVRYTTVCTLVFPSVSGNIRVQAEQINPQRLLSDCNFGNFFSYKQLALTPPCISFVELAVTSFCVDSLYC
jgi:hypothetical protein